MADTGFDEVPYFDASSPAPGGGAPSYFDEPPVPAPAAASEPEIYEPLDEMDADPGLAPVSAEEAATLAAPASQAPVDEPTRHDQLPVLHSSEPAPWSQPTIEVPLEMRAQASVESAQRAAAAEGGGGFFEEVFQDEPPMPPPAPALEPDVQEEASDFAQTMPPTSVDDLADLAPPVFEPAAFEAPAPPPVAPAPMEEVAAPHTEPQVIEEHVVDQVPAAPETEEWEPEPALESSFADLAPGAPAEAPAPASAAAEVPVPIDMVEKIAQRVVAQISEKVIREIAWEVIPDLAERSSRRRSSASKPSWRRSDPPTSPGSPPRHRIARSLLLVWRRSDPSLLSRTFLFLGRQTKTMSHRASPRPTSPKDVEQRWYAYWEEGGFFTPTPTSGKPPFAIVIPPPNVTGSLHMGHAFTHTLQDVLVRRKRMRASTRSGCPARITRASPPRWWSRSSSPEGGASARRPRARGVREARLGVEGGERRPASPNQLKRAGLVARLEARALHAGRGPLAAVREVFVRLYEEGLIYRGERIINWCPRCQTALSDLEVDPEERKGSFWHYLRYRRSRRRRVRTARMQLVIATTRPETLLGDTAVAVHPKTSATSIYRQDARAAARSVARSRSSPTSTSTASSARGAVKVTPAHDFNDYELGKRHDLPIDLRSWARTAKITAERRALTPGLRSLRGARASRRRISKSAGLLVKIEDHTMQRRPLPALRARRRAASSPSSGSSRSSRWPSPRSRPWRRARSQFVPESWEKTYFDWMDNIRDWCISRQLWWGHQIPAWYCATARRSPSRARTRRRARKCGVERELDAGRGRARHLVQLGALAVLTLGWPEKTAALETFYPTSSWRRASTSSSSGSPA